MPRTQRIRWPKNRQEIPNPCPLRRRPRLDLLAPSRQSQLVAAHLNHNFSGRSHIGCRRLRGNVGPRGLLEMY